jgi:hypothetical protein
MRRLSRSAKEAQRDCPELASLGAVDESHARSAEREFWREAQTDNVVAKVYGYQL